ncbi:MAG: hypothetical protein ACYS1A_19710 [Planctomycetota bacterium]|jgi:hypothetical protein
MGILEGLWKNKILRWVIVIGAIITVIQLIITLLVLIGVGIGAGLSSLSFV